MPTNQLDNPTPTRIVVIGGGITGLAATHQLCKLCSEKNIALDVILLEASDRLGGVIQTSKRDGFPIESGPDSFISQKPEAVDLCHRIGIADQLIPTVEAHRRAFVVHKSRLVPIPEGFILLAPTKLNPLIKSPLFSWKGKLRMGMDLLLPAKKDEADESLASFVTRRLGREALDSIVQPLVAGIYTANPEELSLRATMPQFLNMEQQHGSVIRGLRRQMIQQQNSGSGARYSLFVSLQHGQNSFVDALTRRLPENSIRLNSPVKQVLKPGVNWSVTLENGTALNANAVIICLPGPRATELLKDMDSKLAADLTAIKYASSAVINMAWHHSDIPHPLNGFGFVVPAIERRSLIACSFSSVKFKERAPDGHVLLRCFIGGALQPEMLELDDVDMLAAIQRDLRDLLGITSPPLFTHVQRHFDSMPQYAVGHLDLVARLRSQLSKYSGLALAGNAFEGIGIPDCIRSGEKAAEDAVGAISK